MRYRDIKQLLAGSTLVLLAAGCAKVGGDDGGGGGAGNDDCAPPAQMSMSCGRVQIVDGDMDIGSCADFSAVPDGCWKLTGVLTISGEAVTSVARLGGLQHVNGLVLDDTGLTTFDSPTTVTVANGIGVTNNQDLADLDGLTFEDDLDIVKLDHDPKLRTIGDLANVSTFDSGFIVTNDRSLQSLDLSGRSMGSFVVTDDAALSEIALPNLTSIGVGSTLGQSGDFDVERVPALATLTADHLKSVAGNLIVVATGLATLGNLGTSVTAGWGVTITDNAALADLGQLSHAHKLGSIDIENNEVLECQAIHEVACCAQSDGVTADGNATATCTGNQATPWCQANGGWSPPACYHN